MEPTSGLYPPIAVANYFIQKSLDTGIEVTPMKLLKLVYISHGWSLGLLNEPLINEAVEAWTYGPVIPSLYRQLKEYGRGRVTKLLSFFQWGNLLKGFASPTIPEADTRTRDLLENVWNAYGDKSGLYLSAITHKPATPWSVTPPNGIIAQDIIKEHYRSLARVAA